jgi:hypothetical protein
MDRAGDRSGIATDLGAEPVQESASLDAVIEVGAGDVPQVSMPGDDAQRRGGASADHDRRMRSLEGFGVAERSGQLEVGAVEVERFVLGPQPPDDRARFVEACDRVGEVKVGQSVRWWLRRFYAYFTSKRFVAAALLEHADRHDPVFGAGYARVLNAGRPLLRAAQKSGEIRTDLTLEQILDMVAAIAKIPEDAGYREPILRAALDALPPPQDG